MVKKRKSKSPSVDLLRIAYFILLNTLIFHEMLSTQWQRVHSLRKIRKDMQTQLLTQWEIIETDINYKPIFKLARQILEALLTSPQTELALLELRQLALSVVGSGVQLRHDLMGRIYHKLLLQTTGGYYATYYTSVPAAVLISDLLVKTPNPSWDFADLDMIKQMKIIDPACGSGTLLAATYAAIRDRVILEPQRVTTTQIMAELHKSLMENGLYGLDVLDYAAHLTLTTLAMQNPRARFQGSRIRTLNNGVSKDGRVFLGSLDYLDRQRTLSVRRWSSSPTDSSDSDEDVFVSELPEESFDIVVMNPPFSRSANPNLKFGYAKEEIRKKMGERLKELTREIGLEGIGVAGLGSHFIVIGDKMLKPGGRIGIVIPRHILSGVSWGKIRKILMDNYSIEYIISNFDPEPMGDDTGWCWSENTDLGEVLIIARKYTDGEKPTNCLYVNITRHPNNEVESLLLSQEIRCRRAKLTKTVRENTFAELAPGEQMFGYAYFVERKDFEQNWHFGCLFSHPELVKLGLELVSNDQLTPLDPFLASKGRDIAMVKKHFKQAKQPTSYTMLWGHQGAMDTLLLPDSFIGYGIPKKGDDSKKLYNEYSSTVLIVDRSHISTECLLALETTRPVLSTAFWEIKLSDDEMKPLILLWVNSTYGLFMTLGAGANSKGDIFKVKQDHLGNILIPKPSNLQKCADEYDAIKRKKLRPFQQEFELAANGEGIRKHIDNFFSTEFGLPAISPDLYKLLCTEPALTRQRRQEEPR